MNRRLSYGSTGQSIDESTPSPFHDHNSFYTRNSRVLKAAPRNSSLFVRRSGSPSTKLSIVGSGSQNARKSVPARPSSAQSSYDRSHEVSIEETYITNLQQQVQLLEMELHIQKKLNEEQSKQIRYGNSFL
jgi:hypothetical protein